MEATNTSTPPVLDFGQPQDMSKNIIKVIGVGGGGCNAVKNMYKDGITNVTFAVCNTDSQSLSKSPVPVKVLLGKKGLGAGGDPSKGREEAENDIDAVNSLFDKNTKMVFVTAGMGGGTGTGAAPVVAGAAKSKGILTVGIVTIPFYFEKRRKIIKALKGVEEMRKNVDALLIVNNERLCDVYADSHIPVKEAFHRADEILGNATRSISELITVEGTINLDFCDVESTMRGGGSSIMAMGRAKGEKRIQNAILNALDSPLLYGSDISMAKRILFNIYTGSGTPLHVDEMEEIDSFMDELDPNIEVIWGVSDDESLGEDAKVTILATGLDAENESDTKHSNQSINDDDYYDQQIAQLYKNRSREKTVNKHADIVTVTDGNTNSNEHTSDALISNKVETLTEPEDNEEEKNDTTEEPEQPRVPSFVERIKQRIEKIAKEIATDATEE